MTIVSDIRIKIDIARNRGRPKTVRPRFKNFLRQSRRTLKAPQVLVYFLGILVSWLVYAQGATIAIPTP